MDGEITIALDLNAGRDLTYYKPLYQAAVEGNWDAAREFIMREPNALTAIISDRSRTMLHVAAEAGHSEFVEKLVGILPAESLDASDDSGDNALHYVARSGTVQSAWRMVYKNRNLLQSYNSRGKTPLYAAAFQGRQSPKARKEMVQFLAKITIDEPPTHAFTGKKAEELILEITDSGFYDTTLFLLKHYPGLAVATKECHETILHGLARDPSSFQERSNLAIFKRRSYRRTKIIDRENIPIEITKLVCASARSLDFERREYFALYLVDALHVAIMNGVIEMVRVCLGDLPNLLWISHNERTLLHVAIEYRQWKVYNYLIELAGEKKHEFAYFIYPIGDNILHLAARMPSSQLDSLRGSALQMQQELQWFKAVENLVDTKLKFQRNREGRTPQQIFTEHHKHLLQRGEEWMKSTSNACMVVATLAATIVFAAIITVPGGSKDETGVPIFLEKKSFMVYAVSVTLQ